MDEALECPRDTSGTLFEKPIPARPVLCTLSVDCFETVRLTVSFVRKARWKLRFLGAELNRSSWRHEFAAGQRKAKTPLLPEKGEPAHFEIDPHVGEAQFEIELKFGQVLGFWSDDQPDTVRKSVHGRARKCRQLDASPRAPRPESDASITRSVGHVVRSGVSYPSPRSPAIGRAVTCAPAAS